MRQSKRLQHVIVLSTIARLVGIFDLASKCFGNRRPLTITANHPSTAKMFRLGFIPSKHPPALRRPFYTLFRPHDEPLYTTNDCRLFATEPHRTTIQSVAIVGGGLAGLSTACALLCKTHPSGQTPQITIFDKEGPGCGGASSVAGGLLHPFSVRGKLVHLGREGLDASNALIQRAQKHEPNCVIRDQLYRIALDESHETKLRQTSESFPGYATWLTAADIEERCGTPSSRGGLILTDGCKVVHVPTYLKGLWKDCQELSGGTARWCVGDDDSIPQSATDWKKRLAEFDAVVLSAGSGLIEDSIVSTNITSFPAMLVRGQSIEMSLDGEAAIAYPNEAILCGKYMTPLPDGKVLIGATHEFKTEAMDAPEVAEELRSRSLDLSPHVWEHGTVDRITSAYRVQSQRGKYGRMPIIGRAEAGHVHGNAWLFTGLSSRGLIHHGVYGDILSDAILEDDECVITQSYPDIIWWK